MRRTDMIGLALLLAFAALGAVLVLAFSPLVADGDGGAAEATSPPAGHAGLAAAGAWVLPPRPREAPEAVRGLVTLGDEIVRETRRQLPDHVGNRLACASCHLDGGMTDGGRGGGISLVGVAARYPWRDRPDVPLVTLADRIERCFVYGLAGRAPPRADPRFQALLAYLTWISRDVPVRAATPWLGLPALRAAGESAAPDAGALFREACRDCHGPDGGGTLVAPPLWGPVSFRAGWPMARAPRLAAFVHANMPRGAPTLTTDEAVALGAYLAARPRPAAP